MKQKNNFKYILEFYKESLTTQKSLLIFLFSIVVSIYGIIQIAFKSNYSVGFIKILTFPIYIVCLLLILLFNTKIMLDTFENNNFFIIRFSSRKRYLLELMKCVSFSNFCTLLLNLVFLIIGLNLFNINSIIPKDEIYIIPSNYYIYFIIIKFVILSQIISLLNVVLLKMFDNKYVIIVNVIAYILIAGIGKQYTIIDSIFQIPYFIGDYFLINFYSSIYFEMLSLLLYTSLMMILIFILKKIALKTMKEVGK